MLLPHLSLLSTKYTNCCSEALSVYGFFTLLEKVSSRFFIFIFKLIFVFVYRKIMFCPLSCVDKSETMLEELQNLNNWKVSVPRRKRFLARQIHKLKKLLKFGSNSFKKRSLEERQNNENAIEHRQNRANEALERLAQRPQYLEDEQNMVNENWENWDCCYLCANQQPLYPAYNYPSYDYPSNDHNQRSICYVFMPGQAEPVPVKLRNAQIPGGVMFISYQPDLDIRAGDLHAFTSSQIPQGQRAILV